MKNLKEHDSELFYVDVKDPNEVRRYILETLKEILEVLQRFEKFRSIRHEKFEKIQRIRTMLKEANRMMGTVKAKLPQTNLKANIARQAPSSKVRNTKDKKGKSPEKRPVREKTELEKLESELGAIENKLKSLT